MSWGFFIQILKETFHFTAALDVPGIGVIVISLTSNILSWTSSTAIDPAFTYIMTGLAAIYLVIKIINAILTGKSIKLDNKLKEKNLEE